MLSDTDVINVINNVFGWLNNLNSQQRRIASYHARREVDALRACLSENPKRLEPHGYKIYSQNDEDGIIEEIFNRLNITNGSFCEIGVESGIECNTLYLLHKGWRGCWIEGNQQQKDPIESKFGSLLKNLRLGVCIDHVSPENINSVISATLSSLNIEQKQLDFLSIDVDGMDIYLLEALRFQPKVICIEYNGKFPPHLSKRPLYDPEYSWKGTDYMGSSLRALTESAQQLGYVLVGTNITGANAFFVRNDLTADLFETDASAANLYNPCRYHLTFDLFQSGFGHPADFGPYADLL